MNRNDTQVFRRESENSVKIIIYESAIPWRCVSGRKKLNKIIENVFALNYLLKELLYPHKCPFCGTVTTDSICGVCRQNVIFVEEPRCKKCGKPVRAEEQEYCNDCKKREHAFETGISIFLHQGTVAQSLYRFKYHNKRIYAKDYARLFMEICGKEIRRWGIDVLIAVPVHRKRKRKRGYNQAEILAEAISEISGIPYIADAVVRVNETIPQKRLDPSRRRKNMEHAFRMQKVLPAYSHVLIIDDIYTTGATIDSLAKKLKKQGVKVYFFTISIGQGF